MNKISTITADQYGIPTAPAYNFAASAPSLIMPVTAEPRALPGQTPAAYTTSSQQNSYPRLEQLARLNQVFVMQKKVASCSCEPNNRYDILQPPGEQILSVTYVDCWAESCKLRPSKMMVLDNYEHEVIHLSQNVGCCFPSSMEVQAPPGIVIGTVTNTWSFSTENFAVTDETGRTVYYIEKPKFQYSCCVDIPFRIFEGASSNGGREVGKISRDWTGLPKEFFTYNTNYWIAFPLEADVKKKALLLGACMLLQVMYLERTNRHSI